MKRIVPLLVVMLLVLHQDDWFFGFWEDPEPLFGFMPATLLYHAGISLAAGLTWFLAITFCWPDGIDHVEPETAAAETKDGEGQV